MIVRIWHGWTTPEHADEYESLMEREIFARVQSRKIHGFEGVELLRRNDGDEVEFITMMKFGSYAAIRAFAGDDYEAAVVPQEAQEILTHWDDHTKHYEVRAEESGGF